MIACKEWREQLVTIKKNRSLVDINRDESELLCCVCKIICNSKCNLMYMNMEILMTALMITIDYNIELPKNSDGCKCCNSPSSIKHTYNHLFHTNC
jgi:hypothetical protein